MTQSVTSKELVQQAIAYHGHSCPGLAIGIRAVDLATAEFGSVPDVNFIAVVETDRCPVDGIQFLTGCTFGKGNLIHRDYGKTAFTFYHRSDGKALRIISRPEFFKGRDPVLSTLRKKSAKEGLTPEEDKQMKDAMAAQIRSIMEAALDSLFEIKPARGPIPEISRMMANVICQVCGEETMETRTGRQNGRMVCIPCLESQEESG